MLKIIKNNMDYDELKGHKYILALVAEGNVVAVSKIGIKPIVGYIILRFRMKHR